MQFFVLGDGWEEDDDNNNNQVIYHDKIEKNENLLNHNILYNINIDDFSLKKEYSLKFKKKTDYTDCTDYNFENVFSEIKLNKEEYLVFDDLSLSYGEHKLLGHPNLAQSDPREDVDDKDEYVLLFQISSEGNGAPDNHDIMFGDCGILHFFIKKEDLMNFNFDNTLYEISGC